MIRSFKELIEKVQNGEPQTLSVAVAQDADVLLSVWNAYKNKIIHKPKERLLYILPYFPDRVVHHAIM